MMASGSQEPTPRILNLAMLAQFTVGGATLPFVTLLFRERGLDYSSISHIFTASSSTLLVFPFLWGMVSDRYIPINRVFTILNLVAGCALVVMVTQTSYLGLLLSFVVFYAFYHPTFTLINALGFHHLPNPEAQFGTLRAWGSFGWIVPSLPIFLWLAYSPGSRLDFTLYLAIGFAFSMTALTFFLPHTEPGSFRKEERSRSKRIYWTGVKRLFQNPDYVILLLSFFLVSGSFSILVYFSPSHLENLGVERKWIGPIQCFGVLLEIAVFPWLRWFIQRWGYATALVIGCVSLVVRHTMFVVTENIWLLSMSYLFAGMVIVFYHISASILANLIATIEVRATAQTLLVFFGSGLGPMFGNFVVGIITRGDEPELRSVFVFAAILAIVATLLVLTRARSMNLTSQECAG